MQAEYELNLEKNKISAATMKAEELYSDIQRRKKHLELTGFQQMAWFVKCADENEFLEKGVTESQPIDFDLVRMDLNFKAYFPELEKEYRAAEKLVYETGKIQTEMLFKFRKPEAEKKDLNGRYLTAQNRAVKALDDLSHSLTVRIGEIMRMQNSSEQ
ncbi:hypothetical protein A8B77_10035 [Erythrobacter sp. EhN03]|nr:hypothetical protein A8B77_10035 [Erythrobacter sp. EhN03]